MKKKEDLFELLGAITGGGFNPPVHPEFLKNIDWKLLREQKETLHHVMNTRLAQDINKNLYGIMHLIDALQDFAVDEMELSEEEVFNLNSEEE